MVESLHSENKDKTQVTSMGKKSIFILLGPILFFLMFMLPTPSGMSPEAVKVAAVALWMIVWWVTEAVPIYVTALLPLILFPLTGFSSIAKAAAPFSNHLIFLFIGGFMIALTLQRWNVHKRIAWAILSALGTSPRRMLLGFMVSTALISMWISNTATTMMMLPVATAVITQLPVMLRQGNLSELEIKKSSKRIGKALMLGVAYSASVGGIGTIIGTPPNTVLAGALKELYSYELDFVSWMAVGVPLVIVGVFFIWLFLSAAFKLSNKVIPGAKEIIDERRRELGPISSDELKVLIVFSLVAFFWITRRWLITPFLPTVNDSTVGMIGAIALFVIPTSKSARSERGLFLQDWSTAVKLPWGIVFLFGGGFSLAAAFTSSQLGVWIGDILGGLANSPEILILIVVVLLVTFLTEITSNTASTTLLMPIMGVLAVTVGLPPVQVMGVAAVAASCAFMLPVATPPNAIVFGSGYLEIRDMVKVGIVLNIGSVVLVSLLGLTLFKIL